VLVHQVAAHSEKGGDGSIAVTGLGQGSDSRVQGGISYIQKFKQSAARTGPVKVFRRHISSVIAWKRAISSADSRFSFWMRSEPITNLTPCSRYWSSVWL